VREQLEQRLAVLKSEYETGQQMLSELEARQARLRETLLRISGAIQVLEELSDSAPPALDEPA
jgi:predicted nuclease with TOPRIM domain